MMFSVTFLQSSHYDTDIFVYECVERYIKKLEKFCIE